MARTDLHRPSAIKPEDYVFVACDYFGGGLEGAMFHGERQAFRAHMAKTGGKFADVETTGTCQVCGARASYVARFHYVPNNEYITTGMDCARKMEIADEHAFSSFQKKVRAGLEANAGKRKALKILDEAGLTSDPVNVWTVFGAMEANPERYDLMNMNRRPAEVIIWDIVTKVVRYGKVSEGQVRFLSSLRQQIVDRAATEAKRKAESANFAPVPQVDGRIDFEGTVLATKEAEGFRPGTTCTKVLVQHATGYKLWGTMPSGVEWKRGDVVAFSARIERSEKDDKFGFYSRPTKPRTVKAAEPVEPAEASA